MPLSSRPHPPVLAPDQPPESVLVLKPSSLGDVVHTLPAVAALKKLWPRAAFRWLVNPEWAPLLQGNSDLEEVLLFPRASFRGVLGPLRLWQWARQFGPSGRADLIVDFQGLLRSALIGRFCARARQRAGGTSRFYGLSDAREGARFFYDAVASVQSTQHAVDRYLALAAALGADVEGPLHWPLPAGPLPEGFGTETPYVLVHPFSRGQGKSLERAELEGLCEALKPLRVVVAGRSNTGQAPSGAEDWLNRTTLPEMIALLRQAAWVISVDSGPMHIAAALSARLVSIHTWSDPQRVGPYPAEAWVWKAGRLFQRGRPEQGFSGIDLPQLGPWVRQRALERDTTQP
jgi:heptosyltransferase-1